MTNPPFRVDPGEEAAVRKRLRNYKLAMVLARQNGAPPPSDDIGFISPYRAQAMARVDVNTIKPGEPWYGSHSMRRDANTVPADQPFWKQGSAAFRESNEAMQDTDRARVNAYSLIRALKARQEQAIAEEAAKQRGTPKWR